ncbi:MAG: RHS repeat-associated core domain-containing protein, partial [Acidobacteriota bacterium]
TNLNRQVQASRVVFHDDAGRYADTEWSDFDGLGHFRRTVTTGSFRSDSKNSERREGFVAYDRVAGTYGTAGYEPPGTDEPWVLQTFGYTEVSEDDAFGESTARVEHDFEQASGFLTCTRTLTSGTERAANDVLQVFERNELGEVTDVKTYGGDRQILATGGEPCGSLPAQPAFWESHTYQFGVLESTRARTPAGEDGPFLLYDVDLDPSTGRVVKQRSPAGFEETFDYDLLGRLVAVTPLSGGRRTIDYTAVSANAPASSTTTIRGARGNGALVQQVVELDGFGYRRVERRSMPGGAWAERQIRRNARGWTTAVSEWGATDKATEVLVFSPFGRPKTIQLPSGPGHEVGLSYQGDRRVTRQAAVALSGGEAPVSRMLEYDRYNRLRSVEEPSGPAGETVTTTYDYDVAGRLTRMTSGGVSGQVRTFEYDNRGFLLAETHPEKGVGGVTYHDHDARGLAGRQQDGPHDLAMTYDLLGRLLTVRDRSQGQRLVKELEYDTAPGFGLGRLASAARINYVDLPWNSAGEEAVRVEQAYRYEGLGGAPSSRTTSFLDWDQGAIAFEQSAVYDDLGRITQLTYPGCTVGVCSAVGNGRQIDRTYDQGLLTAVAGWATAIDYHSSGLWQRTAHANGVIDHQAQDPDFTGRPLRISTSEAKPLLANFDSGDLAFDDAGNLKAMGGEAFVYDEASRLRQATALDGHWTRAYSYDTFGNLAGTTTDDHGDVESRVYAVDPATNRLVDGSYDAAGNLTAWQGATFTYDTANRLTRQAWMTYLYDASGERVAAIPNVGPGFVTVQFHLRDLSHRLLSRWALVNGEWRHDRDYIYAEDRVLGRVETTSAGVEVAYHHHLDHLGSLRLTTRADGSRHFEHHLLPYGEEWTGGVGASNEEPMLFAGHERDFSVGTDSMHARHYFPALGRFLSTDPAPGDFTAPLSWNRYTYALSNPLTYVDPDGRAAEKPWKKAPPGFLGVFVWTFTSSPVAWLEKTAFFSVAATAAVPAAVALDVLVNPLRLIPEVDRKVTRSLGNRPFPITREVAAAFYDGYVEAVGLPFDLSWLQEELDAIGRVGPTVAGDRSWWRSLGVNNVSDGKIGPEQSLFCGAQTCVEVNGVPFEIQQEVIAHQLAAQDSVASLDLFRCMLSPTSCFAVLTGGGGGRPSGGLWDLYY